jgi:predicted enzyme related to lactoylglutathione lyase
MHCQRSLGPAHAASARHLKPKPTRLGLTAVVLGQALLLAAIGLAAAVPARAEPPALPPLQAPEGQEHHTGKVIFVELVTPDLAAAEAFYGGLFGWTFRSVQAGTASYVEAWLDGRQVAGLIHKDLPAGLQRRPAWVSFLSVRDVDATTRLALQNGAGLLNEPHSIPARGREAVLADPQGAVFAVMASSNGDPPDLLAAPGEWIWSSLITSDPETDAAFYQTLFDYEVFDLPADGAARHLMFASEDFARASANSLPASQPAMHPHWLNYVRVDDVSRLSAKVLALGGRVLVEPRIDRQGGKLAIVADPAGAAFGLLEWPAASNVEVAR